MRKLKGTMPYRAGELSWCLWAVQRLFSICNDRREDLNAIKYLSKIHQHLGSKIQANKYENSYKILFGTKEKRELYLYEQEEKSYHVYNEFLKNVDFTKETLENIIIDNFQMLRITEATVYFALAKRIGIDISDNTADEFSRYTQAEKFTYELSQ